MQVIVSQTCWDCEVHKPVSEFGIAKRNLSGISTLCKDCNRKRTALARAERPEELSKLQRDRILGHRARIDKIKIKSGCADCGYKAHACALDFDHLPGFQKKAAVSDVSKFGSWENIEAEIAKCEVVCANCHRVRTANRRKGETHDQG